MIVQAVSRDHKFTININNGYNVYDAEDMMEIHYYHQAKQNMVLNYVGDCIITGTSNNTNESGKKLVDYRIHMYGNSTIYGNGHKVDFSEVKIEYGAWENVYHLIYISGTKSGTDEIIVHEDFEVKIYDFNIYGNNGFNEEYKDNNSREYFHAF